MKVLFKGKPLEVEGIQPKVGENIPAFSVKDVQGKEITDKDLRDEVFILSTFPDINTSVCAKQTTNFNKKVSETEGVKLISLSKNTKAELNDWCSAKGIKMEMVSDTDSEFGKAFGLVIPEMDKLARSVFVITQEGKVGYREIMDEMTNEPNYDAAIDAAKGLL